jgi:hypothetical protein
MTVKQKAKQLMLYADLLGGTIVIEVDNTSKTVHIHVDG